MKSTPEDLDWIIKTAYSPVYPVIARHIKDKFKIYNGICIDVGAGPAPLSIALAKITKLKIYAMDISWEMCQIAEQNIQKEGLDDRIIPIEGNVQCIPFTDEYADLVISRGSMFFWKDLKGGFKEIYRVLKQGGSAYIGGGFGNGKMKEKIKNQLTDENRDTKENFYKSPPKIDIDSVELAVNMAGIKDYLMINDESGLWVIINKV